MVAKKLRRHCSTCGKQFAEPRGYAYCNKECELARRGLDRGECESGVDAWLDRICARRLDLCRRQEGAPRWERDELQAQIDATHAEEAAVRSKLADLDAPRTSAAFWIAAVERESDRFEATMRKSIAQGIRLGRKLVEAKAEIGHGEFGRLFAGHPNAVDGALRISPRWAQMLMRIASNRALANTKHASLLPADLTAVHDLARLPEDQLEQAIAAGTVRPDMRREDVRALLPASEREDIEPDREVAALLAPVRDRLQSFIARCPSKLRATRAHLRELLRQLGDS
jgi:hypothetical protein